MNILYHHRTMGRGGEGHHISSMTAAFRAMDHQVFIASPFGVDPLSDNAAGPLDKTAADTKGIHRFWKFLSTTAPQSLFEIGEIFYNFAAFFRLRKIIFKDPKSVPEEYYLRLGKTKP